MTTDAAHTPATPPPASRALATEAVHAGRDDLAALGLHAPPLDLSTTYPSYDSRAEAARLDAFAATGAELEGPPVYARLGNPTVGRFETALARLEGTEAAVAFASGMAALTAVLLARASLGLRHVVAVRPLYGCSDHLLNTGLLGTEVTWVDPAYIADAIRPDTGLVLVETPANPTLAEIDLRAVAHACGTVPLLADNTFATPSSSGPPSPAPASCCTAPPSTSAATGTCSAASSPATRSSPAPCARSASPPAASCTRSLYYLLLRGLATLPVRMRAASATAATLVERLRADPRVTRVHYPAVGGAMIAFETAGDPHQVIMRRPADHPGRQPRQRRHPHPAPRLHQPPRGRRPRPPRPRRQRPAAAPLGRPGGRRRPLERPRLRPRRGGRERSRGGGAGQRPERALPGRRSYAGREHTGVTSRRAVITRVPSSIW